MLAKASRSCLGADLRHQRRRGGGRAPPRRSPDLSVSDHRGGLGHRRRRRFRRPLRRAEAVRAVGGRRVLDWSLDAARQHCDGVVARGAARPGRVDREPLADAVVAGGATRSGRSGPAWPPCRPRPRSIVVHDARPPARRAELWRAGDRRVDAGADAAVPAVPVTDTIRGDSVAGPSTASGFVAVQTPQGFRAAVLRAGPRRRAEGTDDASLVEAVGGTVSSWTAMPPTSRSPTPHDLAAHAGSAFRMTPSPVWVRASTCTRSATTRTGRSCSAASVRRRAGPRRPQRRRRRRPRLHRRAARRRRARRHRRSTSPTPTRLGRRRQRRRCSRRRRAGPRRRVGAGQRRLLGRARRPKLAPVPAMRCSSG